MLSKNNSSDYSDYKKNYEINFKNNYGPNQGFTKYYFELLNNSSLNSSEIKTLSGLMSLQSSLLNSGDKGPVVKNPYITNHVGFLLSYLHVKKSTFYRDLSSLKDHNLISYSSHKGIYTIKILYQVKEPNKWLKVFNRIWYYPTLSFSSAIVYSFLYRYKNLPQYTNGVLINIKKISSYTGFSYSTVSKTIRDLNDLKLIQPNISGLWDLLVNFEEAQPEEIEWAEIVGKKILQPNFANPYEDFDNIPSDNFAENPDPGNLPEKDCSEKNPNNSPSHKKSLVKNYPEFWTSDEIEAMKIGKLYYNYELNHKLKNNDLDNSFGLMEFNDLCGYHAVNIPIVDYERDNEDDFEDEELDSKELDDGDFDDFFF